MSRFGSNLTFASSVETSEKSDVKCQGLAALMQGQHRMIVLSLGYAASFVMLCSVHLVHRRYEDALSAEVTEYTYILYAVTCRVWSNSRNYEIIPRPQPRRRLQVMLSARWQSRFEAKRPALHVDTSIKLHQGLAQSKGCGPVQHL